MYIGSEKLIRTYVCVHTHSVIMGNVLVGEYTRMSCLTFSVVTFFTYKYKSSGSGRRGSWGGGIITLNTERLSATTGVYSGTYVVQSYSRGSSTSSQIRKATTYSYASIL